MKIKGFDEILQDIENMGGDIENAMERALKKAGQIATEEYAQVISDHRYSGITEDTLVKSPKIQKSGTKLTMNTGFNISQGGLAAIFLDMGTPKQRPIKYVAKIKRSRKIKEAIANELSNF